MSNSITVAHPESQAEQLFLLFHGVGSNAQDLVPMGHRLSTAFPRAFIVSVQAPYLSDFGSGFQWFSVRDVTEDNRVQRVREAMPAFVETVQAWQKEAHVDVARTVLIGFSQGAIMALESTRNASRLSGRVAAIAGRFAQLPTKSAPGTVVHFFHGKRDLVMPYTRTLEAAEHIAALGGDVTADILPLAGHEANAEIITLLIERLQNPDPTRGPGDAGGASPTAAPKKL